MKLRQFFLLLASALLIRPTRFATASRVSPVRPLRVPDLERYPGTDVWPDFVATDLVISEREEMLCRRLLLNR